MNTLAIIPARSGSKGVPGKNFREINGKSLIERCIETVRSSDLIQKVIITTDSPYKIDTFWHMDEEIYIHFRPEALCSDTAFLEDVNTEALQAAEKHFSDRFDITVEVLCSNPCMLPEDIDSVTEALITDKQAQSAVGITDAQQFHPMRMKILQGGYVASFPGYLESGRMNRQDYEPRCYHRTAGILAMRWEGVMKGIRGAALSRGVILPAERCVDIDTPLDWDLAETILKRRENK
jgi:CMP-N-acetylneuraminic acid synthetase